MSTLDTNSSKCEVSRSCCVIVLSNARTRTYLIHTFYYTHSIRVLRHLAKSLSLSLSLSRARALSLSFTNTHTHARTHALTHALTHSRTHAHTHVGEMEMLHHIRTHGHIEEV